MPTSTSCPAGTGTRTSFRSSARPKRCPSCSRPPAKSSPRNGKRMVLGSGARGVQHTLFAPIARAFLRIGLTPNVVTIIGTAGTTITALVLLPMGHLVVGSLVLGVLVLTDSIDGIMARETNTSSTYGAFLDSTLDRVSDAAIFSGVLLWFLFQSRSEGHTPELQTRGHIVCRLLPE